MSGKISDLKKLKEVVGSHAFRALINGRFLNIWRRSSPHNWFIENYNGKDFLWHSDDDFEFRKLPNLSIFKKHMDSNSKILNYWGSDSGMADLSQYILKTEFINFAKNNMDKI